MRIFVLSDLHIDYEENKNWLLSLSTVDYQNDILIFAGDISHKIHLIELAFHEMKKRFNEVFYVPGNHDLWVKVDHQNSLERFHQLMEITQNHGIHTTYKIYDTFAIIPILSWYDYSLGEVSTDLTKRWADFYRCLWPNMNDQQVTEYFLEQTSIPTNLAGKTIITFSHFLSRIDIINGRLTRFLAAVLGTKKLETLIRNLTSHIHIYGHSHINIFQNIDNILYINNAFGYPHETHITTKQLLDITYNVKRQ